VDWLARGDRHPQRVTVHTQLMLPAARERAG